MTDNLPAIIGRLPELREQFGDVTLSAAERLLEIERASSTIKAAVQASINAIAERLHPRPKRNIGVFEILRRACEKGDDEAKLIAWMDHSAAVAPLFVEEKKAATPPAPVVEQHMMIDDWSRQNEEELKSAIRDDLIDRWGADPNLEFMVDEEYLMMTTGKSQADRDDDPDQQVRKVIQEVSRLGHAARRSKRQSRRQLNA